MTGIAFPRPRTIMAANVLALASYFVLMPDTAPLWLAVAVQSLRAAVALMVVIIYGWSVVQICRANEPEPSNGLVIGILLAFAADLYGSIVGLAWRWNGRPEYWTSLAFWFMPAVLTTIAGLHHIAVPDAINGRVPRRNIIWIGVAFGVAGLIAGMIIGSQFPRLGLPG